jgi:CubicO group peptidase (beta-lactamase class C family)
MIYYRLVVAAILSVSTLSFAASPLLPGIGAAMQEMVDKQEIAGAVTAVVTVDRTLHLESTGHADLASHRAMTPDTLFWIASMTKPVTGVAIMMLQDDGKLKLSDPVANYIPEFAGLKSPSGQPANLTIIQILTHTSGLGEASGPAAQSASTLADLVPVWLAAKMQFEPGTQWKYCQSGINLAGRIVEVVSGLSFNAFLQQRLFDPLGMTDTTFYPTKAQRARLATAYAKNKDAGLVPVPPRAGYGAPEHPPQGNGGLFSTPQDYARFCQLLLGQGTVGSQRLLSPAAVKSLASIHTGEIPTGFFQTEQWGKRGANYGWGVGTCILRTPHPGHGEMLSPGSYGHGGAWGTQAWIDPVKGVAYLLFVQRSNFPNSDGSDVRLGFQRAATAALAK